MPHTVSAVLGIVVVLLIGTAVGVLYDYLPSAAVGGLTASGLGFLPAIAFIAAAGTYLVEEANWKRGFTGHR
jgi:hypothetical protein